MSGKPIRRAAQTRSAKSAKPVTNSVDELAERLSSGLVFLDVKGKQKASSSSEEQSRLESMRSVNLASQALSAIVQSGNTGKQSSAATKATSAAATVEKHLAALRRVGSGVFEVERVAVSVLGKLVSLEMYEEAMVAIESSYPRICALHSVAPSTSHSPSQLSLSLSCSPNPTDVHLLTLTVMYLAYALTTFTNDCLSPTKGSRETFGNLNALSQALRRDNPTLLAWLPRCSTLPSKQLDSIITRTYTNLTKSCASLKSNHEAVYILRMYAMECLSYSSTGTVEPNTFWGQVARFAGAFIKSRSVPDGKAIQMVLSAFESLIVHVGERSDGSDFLCGKGFVEFCEYWMVFAKKIGDIHLVDRISALIQGVSATTSSPSRDGVGPHHDVTRSTQNLDNGCREKSDKGDRDALEAARVCATFTQTTTAMEQNTSDLPKRIMEAVTLLKSSVSLLNLLQHDQQENTSETRISNKVDRAIERMRRTVISRLDAPPQSTTGVDSQLQLLQEISRVQQQQCYFPQANANIFTRALDTLFVLAREELTISDPRTYIPAHDALARAVDLIERRIADSSLDIPNYLRCVSGAFHNLAGTLYHASRHGSAIGFLKKACTLGLRALTMRRERIGTVAEGIPTKTEEAWKQLEEQLCRRWELLGVCFVQIGDRKPAFDAFRQYISTFPYLTAEFPKRVTQSGFSLLFEFSNSTRQLASIIDRVTHLSTFELLMEPSAISLASLQVDEPGITGVLLERQIGSLEMSQWKDGVPGITARLFMDVLKVYTSDMPVRRARVLVKCMDFMYYTEATVTAGLGSPEDMGSEVEELLRDEQHFGLDIGLAGFCVQYRAAAHIWLALHAHRRLDMKQGALVTHHLEEACKLVKTALIGAYEPRSSRKSLPQQHLAPQAAVPSPPARKRSTRKAAAVRNTVDPKPKRKALQSVSLNVTTPPRPTQSKKSVVIFDDFEKFFVLLQLATRISGLLALGLLKVHILHVSRKLCDQYLGTQSDGYIISSVDLACEYIRLGKIQRAASIFEQVLGVVKSERASDETSALLFLRFAESLAIKEDIPRSCSVYCKALGFSERLDIEDKSLPTAQRVRTRVKRLERAAIASHTFALIQYAKEDVAAAVDGFLRSLRLWNRALDAIARLRPALSTSRTPADNNPFDMSSLKNVLSTDSTVDHPQVLPQKKIFPQRTSMDGMEWRISEGLLKTLFSLNQIYFNRGSVREAEYFSQQAQDLAESLNAPVMASHALAKRGEMYLHQRQFDTSLEYLTKAATLVENKLGIENINVRRLRGIYKERLTHNVDAHELYEESLNMIEELDQAFKQFDDVVFGAKSDGSPPYETTSDVVLPELFATVLRQRIWLLRENDVQDYTAFLDKLLGLPHSTQSKAEEDALMAKLSLHTVYNRFRGDMFLSSLTESTISLPMGMSSRLEAAPSTSQDIVATLETAKKFFWANLIVIARRGNVVDVRDAVISLALVQAFQTSLGNSWSDGSRFAATLLGSSVAITLRREMLESIPQKFPKDDDDDIQWPLIGPEGSPQTRHKGKLYQRISSGSSPDLDGDDELDGNETSLRNFWASVQTRYQAQTLNPSNSLSQTADLPANWTIVHINIIEDKSTLFITRQICGAPSNAPLVFCVPLKGRRDSGSGPDEDEHLTFDDAIQELKEIVRLSDEGTKAAIHIKAEDHEARASWWKERSVLDTRLRELLENVEFCWLGAFKTILSPRSNLTPELVSDLRSQFEKVFHRVLCVQDSKSKQRPGSHKKTPSQTQALAAGNVTFDDTLLECFSTLHPKCRDEELEDLVYFILDLYQFHGVPVATAEIDVLQVALDLRAVLEDHVQKLSRRRIQKVKDEHVFLVLDKNLQGLPWESIPILRGRSVSRIPSIDFLRDRVLFAQWKRKRLGAEDGNLKGAVVDPRKGYYILNPSGDLDKTEGRFQDWAKDMEKAGWQGVIGRPPSEQQFLNALRDRDLVVYFGHGGGEQYLRSHKVRNLPTCAATMLWGCSSGALREMGDFDRVGTPNSYMLAGCPCLVANLWDVTDRDIDKFSQAVFDKLRITAAGAKQWGRQDEQVSVVSAVGQSRDACKLKYLTGAAPIVYGIPFYV